MTTRRLDHTSGRPLAAQLADVLRTEIQHGHRTPGSRLPAGTEFEDAYGVSRETAHEALGMLASEGLVLKRQGLVYYVRSSPPLRRVSSRLRHAWHRESGKPEFDTEAIAQGQVPSRRMLRIGRGPVPEDIADWLGVEVGEDVMIRSRLQHLDGVPAAISTSYFPLWLTDGTRLESSEPLPEGPDNLLEDLGYEFASGVELIRARMPTPDEAELLELGPGVPVVRLLQIDYDPQDRTLQVADDLYAGDQHEFAAEWAEPDGPVRHG
jgi:GntR family transcriptional regulator